MAGDYSKQIKLLTEFIQNSRTLSSGQTQHLDIEQKENLLRIFIESEEELLISRKHFNLESKILQNNTVHLIFSSHLNQSHLNNLRSKDPLRADVVKSAITPGQYEDQKETPILSLEIAVKLLIHCGGVITISEFHSTIIRAGFYSFKKPTLSARMNDWSKRQGYFKKLIGAKGGWVLNLEGIDRLKERLKGIDDIIWDAIPPTNPDDDLDVK